MADSQTRHLSPSYFLGIFGPLPLSTFSNQLESSAAFWLKQKSSFYIPRAFPECQNPSFSTHPAYPLALKKEREKKKKKFLPLTPPQMAPEISTGSDAVASASSSSPVDFKVKTGLAQMLKGGVIMDVVNAEQARIAEEAGACAVMALERVPADIRAEGGVSRMSDPSMIKEIMEAVTIPVMAKARIGHFVECQILEAVGVDYIDESEVLTPADHLYHVTKHNFRVPFVCGCRNLGEALRRISEGAAMIRTKGEAGTGDVVEAVSHMRTVNSQIAKARSILLSYPNGSVEAEAELRAFARELECPYELLLETAEKGRLPVVNFAAGGVATPADAALMMQLGCDGVFVGSGIFKSGDPRKRAKAIVQAVTHFKDAKALAELSQGLGEAMVGISVREMRDTEKLATRGW
ncbi:pyridoxine biosynthesis protein pyroA [Histoplasma capsulatum var. duboisii H88]|uniref:pyridoxal 5'-phosphate synthase (glutamine hydrolyzing) n=2 Tax=Ajellomyces capsulatus (strain H88) TaxID=544711 RepID=A0A8A1LPI4_AJEC8|nr:pyridoxine biosynthesis protein pyroA [Histoplasma capsulatum var. duboisii H88]